MKKLIQAILMAVFMMLLVIPQAVQAQEYSSEQDYYQAVQNNQRVYDFAELLSDSEREKRLVMRVNSPGLILLF